MATDPVVLQGLLLRLGTEGAVQGGDLARVLGISAPTLSRAVAELGGQIVRFGKARRTRYAAVQTIQGMSRWPVYRIHPDGRSSELGQLVALRQGQFLFQPIAPAPALLQGEFDDGLFPDLPWFLDDQRPQGFLGRAMANRIAPLLGLPPDLNLWTPIHHLTALLGEGADAQGDLVIGERAMQAALAARLAPPRRTDAAGRLRMYETLAAQALAGGDVGSSTGGEQPKFTAVVESAQGLRPVIVKFSEAGHTPSGQRWRDLLHCEHLAGSVLHAYGIRAAVSQVLHTDERVYLESTRFDRTPAFGRVGFVSVRSLDAAFYGQGNRPWWRVAEDLLADGWITADDAGAMARAWWFGSLIGNTDMHLGNIGLSLQDMQPLPLAPLYDMLPMQYRPGVQGAVVDRDIQVPLPLPAQRDDWRWAAAVAAEFWESVAGSNNISPQFRAIAAAHLVELARANGVV